MDFAIKGIKLHFKLTISQYYLFDQINASYVTLIINSLTNTDLKLFNSKCRCLTGDSNVGRGQKTQTPNIKTA